MLATVSSLPAFFLFFFSCTEMHVHLSCRVNHFHFTPAAVEAQLTNTGFLSFTVCDSLFFLPPSFPSLTSLPFPCFFPLNISYILFACFPPHFPWNLHYPSLFSPFLLLTIGIPISLSSFHLLLPLSVPPSLLNRPHSPHHRAAGLYSEALCTLWKIFPGVLQPKR